MDFLSKRHLMYASKHISSHGLPTLSPMPSYPNQISVHNSNASFPFGAILVIGLMSTSFLLMTYYFFVIKCCLNSSHRADLVRRFPLSRIRDDASYRPQIEPRGLTESAIRSIPVIRYEKELGNCRECSVCLNEFQQDEKLRVIPNCSHIFHIDCIDIWLQNNSNCPICRRNISLLTEQIIHDNSQVNQRPSPEDQSPHVEENIVDGYEDFVAIDLSSSENFDNRDQNLEARQERDENNVLEQRTMKRKKRELEKFTSIGDECVVGNYRAKDDENFLVQPIIRRSFSVDSSRDREFHLAVEHVFLQQQNEARSIEVCGGSGRVKRSFFSFGHGSRSRNSSVLPVYFDP